MTTHVLILICWLCGVRGAPTTPIISEFMACNQGSLLDADHDSSDWIEIQNPGTALIGLDGWYLTDDLADLKKWRFPAVQIAAGQCLVVFASGKDRRDPAHELHTNFALQAAGESVALVQPDGKTIAAVYPDYPQQYADLSYGLRNGMMGYLQRPTPGAANQVALIQTGPALRNVTKDPPAPAPGESLVITAEVTPTTALIRSVTLSACIGYPTVRLRTNLDNLPMVDDGTGADAVAGDGIYTAAIPASAYRAGDMVRWYVTAQDTQGQTSRAPLFPYPDNSPQYYGTVVRNAGLVSALPIFYWFTENPAAARTRTGTRGSVYFDGEFYDNVFIRQRGGATVGAASKKYVFNDGHDFRFSDDGGRVHEINLNQNGSDPTYLRPPLAFETIRQAGCPASQCFLMLVMLNGQVERVGVFVEQVDAAFLERHGLDPRGALYKFVQRSSSTPVFSDTASGIEKKTRRYENLSDIQAVVQGLNAATAEQRRIFVFDNFNLPEMLDYLAARCLLQDTDDIRKNFYFYRDTNGSGAWSIFPWDKDWTFGVVGDGWIYTSHPFLGDAAHPKNNGLQWSIYLDVMYNLPQTREMLLRRTRTVMDEQLQPPGTPAARGLFETRLDDLFAPARPYLGNLDASVTALKSYFPTRRTQLYVDHNVHNRTNPPVGGNAGIPDSQPANATLAFGAYDYNPVSGNQDEEYLELINPNSYAVDLSGWQLTGGWVRHTFHPGTVLVAGGRLYATPNARAFRHRATSPKGGEGRFVQGSYQGHLSSWGDTIRLQDRTGRTAASLTYIGVPSDQERFLRVTELMYHPAPGGAFDQEEYEFIELKNIGAASLKLDGVKLTKGVSYAFAPTGNLLLAPGACIVLVKNRTAFASRYPSPSLNLAPGVYRGSLDNSSATIELQDRTNSTILEFKYSDGWYSKTDGQGYSLTLKDPANPNLDSWSDPGAWQASAQAGGSPGM